MPVPVPPPTHFAPIDDAGAVPWVSEAGRAAYRLYLTRPTPRAFLVATTGGFVSAISGFDPLGRGIQDCAKAHLVCRPYAVDDEVVWVPPAPPASLPASRFAALDDVTAVPWVNATSRAAYARFLTQPLPRAFVVAPGGQSASALGGYDPLARALALCTQHNLTCRPYAVNDTVVWSKPPRK